MVVGPWWRVARFLSHHVPAFEQGASMGRLIVVKAPKGESVGIVIGRQSLPGEVCEFAEVTAAGDELVNKYGRPEPEEAEAEVVVVELAHPLLDMNAKEARAWAGAVPEGAVDVLADALAAEKDGRGRKSVIKAIEARLDELTGGD